MISVFLDKQTTYCVDICAIIFVDQRFQPGQSDYLTSCGDT